MSNADDLESAGPRSGSDEDPLGERDIGWPRALASGLGILIVGFIAGVYATNAVVTKVTGVSRATRQYLAGALLLVAVAAMAWVLRRLQARRIV